MSENTTREMLQKDEVSLKKKKKKNLFTISIQYKICQITKKRNRTYLYKYFYISSIYTYTIKNFTCNFKTTSLYMIVFLLWLLFYYLP